MELLPKLESVAPHVWAWAMRQVWVATLLDAIFGMVSLGFIAWVYLKVRALPGDNYDDKAMAWGGWLFLTAMLGTVGVICLYNAVINCLNPEWQAVKYIVGLFVSK